MKRLFNVRASDMTCKAVLHQVDGCENNHDDDDSQLHLCRIGHIAVMTREEAARCLWRYLLRTWLVSFQEFLGDACHKVGAKRGQSLYGKIYSMSRIRCGDLNRGKNSLAVWFVDNESRLKIKVNQASVSPIRHRCLGSVGSVNFLPTRSSYITEKQKKTQGLYGRGT